MAGEAKCLCCRRSTGRTIALILFMIVYLLLGAVVFSLIESPVERQTVQELKNHRRDFMMSHNNCLTDEELERFIVHVVEAQKRGISASANVSSESSWSFGQSLFFASTVLTTIGYGHTTPLSEGGKVFCIFYAVIGIPMTLIMFTAIVERLMVPSTRVLQFMFTKYQQGLSPFTIRLLHLTSVFILLLTFIFVIPASIFMTLEPEWTFLDSLYYCVISMTTIGLGDYIPGENDNQQYRILYKICITIYLYMGLIFMMFTLAVVYEIPELNLGMHFYMQSDSDDGQHDSEKQRLRDSETSDARYTDDNSQAEKPPLKS